MDVVWIGLGGVVGVNARYFVGRWFGNRYGASFPYGTLVINVSGAFLIGFLLTILTERLALDPRWRLGLVVGLLGGYTTFSSYAYEAFALADRGAWFRSGMYVIGTNVIGLLACALGVMLARVLR